MGSHAGLAPAGVIADTMILSQSIGRTETGMLECVKTKFMESVSDAEYTLYPVASGYGSHVKSEADSVVFTR